jgi:hypothetical protein
MHHVDGDNGAASATLNWPPAAKGLTLMRFSTVALLLGVVLLTGASLVRTRSIQAAIDSRSTVQALARPADLSASATNAPGFSVRDHQAGSTALPTVPEPAALFLFGTALVLAIRSVRSSRRVSE